MAKGPRHEPTRSRAFSLLAAALLVPGLCGCGGSSATQNIQSDVQALHVGFVQRDAAAVCAHVTSTYWGALRARLQSVLSSDGLSLPGSACRADLAYVFRRGGGGAQPAFILSSVSVHGANATATLRLSTSDRGAPARFVEGSDGNWRLDCCTGAQLDHQPWVTYRMPSPSMLPTIKVGQTFVADEAVLRRRAPRFGEIVIFHPPRSADGGVPLCPNPRQGEGKSQPCGGVGTAPSAQVFLKRVVGLPGDRIAIAGGHIVRNGRPAPEPFIKRCAAGGNGCNFPAAIVVPPGTYYLLGDNRGNSLDSRYFGPVRRSWILGLVRIGH